MKRNHVTTTRPVDATPPETGLQITIPPTVSIRIERIYMVFNA
ncbi:hypothetical protein NXF25_001561 [Crotalus adamanteus]|uniref:Uncharacterized protein n=1 Tax=Crotalus adamanteus TaxID=8729 RepID=A0AAW1C7A7_CROAD